MLTKKESFSSGTPLSPVPGCLSFSSLFIIVCMLSFCRTRYEVCIYAEAQVASHQGDKRSEHASQNG